MQTCEIQRTEKLLLVTMQLNNFIDSDDDDDDIVGS
jgi:hypothetical protein